MRKLTDSSVHKAEENGVFQRKKSKTSDSNRPFEIDKVIFVRCLRTNWKREEHSPCLRGVTLVETWRKTILSSRLDVLPSTATGCFSEYIIKN